ncbi:MAG: hypothetical protein MUF52_16250 [Syntrophobacteraceae bacterium]|jgi:hypothetical protein|nr:hypothetical protein [Syntrophobacteraceae bacterium]
MTVPAEQDVLMTIQNSKKPNQVIYVVRDDMGGWFRTQGLKSQFGVSEIRMSVEDLIHSIQEFGEVLSFLFESMSAAQDLNLPFAYENEFDFHNQHFTLYADGDHRVLKRVS